MGRAPCCLKDAGLNRGAWTAEEDSILTKYISIHGDGGWKYLPQKAGLKRCGKSCRLRWLNYLRPDIKRGNISADEEELIIRMHKLLGNRWSLIAGRLPGRTDNEIKNYWNTQLVKKMESKEYCLPTAKDICITSKPQNDCSEDHKVLRSVAVRASMVSLPKDIITSEVANFTSVLQETKLQREVSEIVEDISASWRCQCINVEGSSAQNTMQWESPRIEIMEQPSPTLFDNQFSECPNKRINEVSTCNSSLYLNEMFPPEDNLPWSPYDFLTEKGINESQYLQM